jgi:hypothetical protein
VIRAAPGEAPTRIAADDGARQYEILRDGVALTREAGRP